MAYIQPTPTPAPLADEALENLFQEVIVGITGLPAKLVRPRWQPEPANMPAFGTDWAAVGVMNYDQDRFAFHRQLDALTSQIEMDQELEVLMSFYGPNGQSNALRFLAGIQVSSNRAQLDAAGVKLVEVQKARQLPALFKEKWTKRQDILGIFRYRIKRVYAVNAVESVNADLDNEYYITPIIVSPPTP